MKVLLNPTLTTIRPKHETGVRNPLKEKQNINNEKFLELPNYRLFDSKFKYYNINAVNFGAKLSVTNEKFIREIESLKLEKEGLLSKAAASIAKEAQENLDRIADWGRTKGIKYYSDTERWDYAISEAKAAGQKAQESYVAGHGSTWKFFHGDGTEQYYNAYESKKNEIYYDYYNKIQELKENKSHFESIVQMVNENEENKQKRISEIDNLIAAKQKLISYQGLQDSVNEMLSAKGGVGDRIAGYQDVKNALNVKFVQPLIKSQSDCTTDVPPAIILYGPTGTGKTTFLNGIREQAQEGGYAEVVDISSVLEGKGYKHTLTELFKQAKDRYFKENKRTIFLLNDAEKIFSIQETDAPIMGITLDDQDRNMIRGHETYDIVAYFKALLDEVSKRPEKGALISDPRSAATFFITTNYPHLIHPDLLSREGKAIKIPVGLASNNDLSEVLRFYFKRMNDVADKLKAFQGNPDYKEAINSMAGITDKARANVIKMIEDGTIDKLKVDYENMPYREIAKDMNPNTRNGAYSNDGIRVICQNAFMDYLERDIRDSDYKDSFFKVYINTRRDINPERLKKFNLINRMLKDVEVDPDTLDQLLLQKKMKLLSEKQANLIKYHATKINADLKTLEELEQKEGLSAEQLKRKAELQQLKDKIETSENETVENINEDEF